MMGSFQLIARVILLQHPLLCSLLIIGDRFLIVECPLAIGVPFLLALSQLALSAVAHSRSAHVVVGIVELLEHQVLPQKPLFLLLVVRLHLLQLILVYFVL